MPSASRQIARLAALAVCGLLLVGALGACSTTQEKAERQQARAKHILQARAERQRKRAHHNSDRPQRKGGQSQ